VVITLQQYPFAVDARMLRGVLLRPLRGASQFGFAVPSPGSP
jgi:hypothetical protein